MPKHFLLKPYNTFGLNITCQNFITISSIDAFMQFYQSPDFHNKKLILGGGSNVLFKENFNGTVIWNQIKGWEITNEDEHFVWIKVGAGEVWHEFVMQCIEKNFGGIENLSLIPGYVGAAPMQNIGAYGVEIKDVCEEVEFVDFKNGKLTVLKNKDCQFGYRESIFKKELKDSIFISSVTFKLSKQAKVNTSYGAIQSELAKNNISNPSIKDVSNAVISIRTSKLPDPKKIGNAGSFFKNPVISKESANTLLMKFPDMPTYAFKDQIKVAAGWLIENAGWKGKSFGDVGVHKKQALVLVNYGNGTGEQIVTLSEQIQESVFQKFGVRLEKEVNIVC